MELKEHEKLDISVSGSNVKKETTRGAKAEKKRT
jgi:hypothetical protein